MKKDKPQVRKKRTRNDLGLLGEAVALQRARQECGYYVPGRMTSVNVVVPTLAERARVGHPTKFSFRLEDEIAAPACQASQQTRFYLTHSPQNKMQFRGMSLLYPTTT